MSIATRLAKLEANTQAASKKVDLTEYYANARRVEKEWKDFCNQFTRDQIYIWEVIHDKNKRLVANDPYHISGTRRGIEYSIRHFCLGRRVPLSDDIIEIVYVIADCKDLDELKDTVEWLQGDYEFLTTHYPVQCDSYNGDLTA